MSYLRICLLLAVIGCTSEESSTSANKRLQQRIEVLDHEIDKYEKKAMDEEMQSMGAFRENYSKFAREMEESEENEGRVRNLEREKEALLSPGNKH